MIVKILNAYMSTVMGENIMTIVDVNQYDHDGKQIQIVVRDMDISGMYAVVDGKKPDDTYVYNKTTISDNSVFVDITLQMTSVSGSYDMQVTLFNESDHSRAGIYKYTLRIAAATVPDPTVVSTDEYTALVTNAKEYDDAAAASAAAASASAASAAESASQAAQSATNAAESERLSGISATDADASNQNAATHEQDAKGYADNAAQSNAAAEQSATNANTAKMAAATSEANAASSAQAAATSEANAASSAQAAATGEANAASSAQAAQTAQAASESARDLAVSAKTAAQTSETNAETAETNASSSASEASSSATNASSSASAAASSASAASSSASSADSAKTAAASSASEAATSASNAASSATAAANSAALIGSEIYGAYWDKGETPTLTRLNLAKGATVNLGVDAVYAINEFDTSSLFASFSNVTDSYGNVFVRIPRIYIKKVDTTGHKAWYASRRPFAGAYLPKCFWDFTNNKELDYVDVGAYNASSAEGTKLDSKPGTYPLVNKTIVQMRTMAQANGAGYQQLDIHVVDLLQTLFIIEQGTIQSQSKVAGFTTGQYTATHLATATETAANRIIVATATAELYEVGQTISIGTSQGNNQIFYGRTITGKTVIDASNTAIEFDGTAVNINIGNVLYNTGAKSGFSANIAASVGSPVSNSSGKFPFAWHGIENLFGSIYQFVDGVNINNRQAWVCPDAASYASNLFTAPYEQLNYVNGTEDGYIKKMGYDPAHPYAALPTAVGGSPSTYYGDYCNQATGQRIPIFGGNWNNGQSAGLFNWSLSSSSSLAFLTIGGRLIKKPL